MSALWTVDLYLLPSAVRSLRLAVQDAALSRRKHEFDSRREHQIPGPEGPVPEPLFSG